MSERPPHHPKDGLAPGYRLPTYAEEQQASEWRLRRELLIRGGRWHRLVRGNWLPCDQHGKLDE